MNNIPEDRLLTSSVEITGTKLTLVKSRDDDNNGDNDETVTEILQRVASKYTMNISGIVKDFMHELKLNNKVLLEVKGRNSENVKLLGKNTMSSMDPDVNHESIEENKYDDERDNDNDKDKDKEKEKEKDQEGEPESMDNVNVNNGHYLHNNKRQNINDNNVYLNGGKLKIGSDDNSNTNFNSNSNNNNHSVYDAYP